MTYENFLKITLGIKKAGEDLHKLSQLKVNLIDFVETYYSIIDTALAEIYTKEGLGWLYWFMYESEFGEKDWSKSPAYTRNENGEMVEVQESGEVRYGATDEDGNPVCYSFESTYEYLKQYRK